MRDRSGKKILPPNKNSLSTDALDGSPVFGVTYSFFTYGYSFRPSIALLHHHAKISRLHDEDRQHSDDSEFVVPVVSL